VPLANTHGALGVLPQPVTRASPSTGASA
jgi:hypothetical protein